MAYEYSKPTTSAGTFSSPNDAFDGVGLDDASTYSYRTSGDASEEWYAFSSLTETITALTINVVWEFVGNGVDDEFQLDYSLDGGNSWETPITSGVQTARAKGVSSFSIPIDQILSNVRVRGGAVKNPPTDSGVSFNIWNIYLESTYGGGGADVYGASALSASTTLAISGEVSIEGIADLSSSATLSVSGTVAGDDTGFLVADSVSSTGWTDSLNAKAKDGSLATYTTVAITVTGILETFTFPLDVIPAGATIDGIEIEVTAKSSAPSNNYLNSIGIYTSANGYSDTKSDATQYGQTLESRVYGSPTDLWGFTAPTRDDIQTIRAQYYGESTTTATRTISVDSILVKVYYTEASGSTINGASALSSDATVAVSGGVTTKSSASLSATAVNNTVASLLLVSAVALSASATVAVSGGADRNTSSSLSSSTTLSVSGLVDKNAQIALSADVSLNVSGERYGETYAIIPLTAGSSLVVDGERYGLDFGAVALSSDATLLVTGAVIHNALADLNAGATLDVSGERYGEDWGSASFSASSTLTVLGIVDGSESGSALLYAGASLSVSAEVDLNTGASLSSDASLDASGERYGEDWGGASLSASSQLTVSGTIGGALNGEVSLNSYGMVEASGEVERTSTVSMDGQAIIAVVPFLEVPASVSLIAVSDLECSSSIATSGSVSLSGNANLITDSTIVHSAIASFQSNASLSVSGEVQRLGNVSVSAQTIFSCVGSLDGVNQVSLSSQTSLTVSGERYGELFGVSDIQSVSSLSIDALIARLASASLSSTSSLEVDGTTDALPRISITASAVLSAYGSTGDIPECVRITDYEVRIKDKPEIKVVGFATTNVIDFEDIIQITDEIKITDCG